MTPLQSVGGVLPAVQPADGLPRISPSVNLVTTARIVAIVGSRHYPQLDRVSQLVAQLRPECLVVSGGAEGVDTVAESAATRRGLLTAVLRPSNYQERELWVKAAFARDQLFPLLADVVVAFWDGQSHGTRETIKATLRTREWCIVALPGVAPEVWIRA